MSDDIAERVARLEEKVVYLEKEIAELKQYIREVNIMTKYVIPILLVIVWVVSALR